MAKLPAHSFPASLSKAASLAPLLGLMSLLLSPLRTEAPVVLYKVDEYKQNLPGKKAQRQVRPGWDGETGSRAKVWVQSQPLHSLFPGENQEYSRASGLSSDPQRNAHSMRLHQLGF